MTPLGIILLIILAFLLFGGSYNFLAASGSHGMGEILILVFIVVLLFYIFAPGPYFRRRGGL